MSTSSRVVVIGTGWIAQKVHLPYFAAHSSARLHGIFDIDQTRSQEIAKQYAVTSYSVLEAALEEADVIVVSSPPSTHGEVVIPALNRGVSVICEKPLATEALVARAMRDAAIVGKGRLFCCLTNRYRQDVMEMRKQVAAGAIGLPLYFRLSWLRGAGIPQTPGAAQSGVLWDLGPHLVDLMMWITGWSKPVSMQSCELNAGSSAALSAGWYSPNTSQHIDHGPETAVLSCRFSGGKSAQVELSWASHLSKDRTELLLIGSDGTLHLDSVFGFSPHRQTIQRPALELHSAGSNVRSLVDQDQHHTEYCRQLDYFIENMSTDDSSWQESIQYAVRSIEVLEQARNNTRNNRSDHINTEVVHV